MKCKYCRDELSKGAEVIYFPNGRSAVVCSDCADYIKSQGKLF